MKISKVTIIFVALGVFFISFVNANAGQNIGTFCWGYDNPTPKVRLKITFFDIGNNQYLCSGVEYQQNGNAKALHGSAELINDSFVLTYTIVQTDVDATKGSFVISKHGELVVNAATLDASLSAIDIKKYADGSDSIGDDYQSLKHLNCQ